MLLDAKTKIDGGPQEDQGLSGLESPLESLSVYDSKGELSELESAISKVSLRESDEDASGNEEAETESEVQTSPSEVVNVTTKEKKSESVPDIHSDRTDDVASDSSEKDDAGYESETEKEEDNDKDDSLTSEKKEKKSLDETKTNDADSAVEDATDRKEKKGDKKSEEEDKKKSIEKKKTTDNGTAEEPAPSGRKLLPRGLGAGTSDQQYPYPYSQGLNFSYADTPNAPSGPFTQAMSPQYAMSPTYMGMAVSPIPGYNESSVHSPLNGMSSMDEICGFSLSQCMIPESPNSLQDESELARLSPLMPDSESFMPSFFPSADDVLEAIAKVENNPNTTSVPEDQVIPIRRSLEESLEGVMLPDVNQDFRSCPNCQDGNITTYMENDNVQNSNNDFLNYRQTELTPPMTDFDLSRREAELEIHQCLDRQLFDKASKKMAKISNEELTKKDIEGDTPCMVVACQQEDSDRFRENLCAMVNRAKTIRMCCEYPINNRTPIKMCLICGNSDEQRFYSPFAMVNNEGDTLLSSVLKVGHSQQVVNFICETIFQNPADVNRIFNQPKKIEFYQYFKQSYPVLGVFLPDF